MKALAVRADVTRCS